MPNITRINYPFSMYLTKNIPSKEEISTLQKVVILKCFIFDDIDQYWVRI